MHLIVCLVCARVGVSKYLSAIISLRFASNVLVLIERTAAFIFSVDSRVILITRACYTYNAQFAESAFGNCRGPLQPNRMRGDKRDQSVRGGCIPSIKCMEMDEWEARTGL